MKRLRSAFREACAEAGSDAVRSENVPSFPEEVDASFRSYRGVWKGHFRKVPLAEVEEPDIMDELKQIIKLMMNRNQTDRAYKKIFFIDMQKTEA